MNDIVRSNFFNNLRRVPKVALLFLGGLLIFKITYDLSQGVQLFGDKNNAFFDAWSLEHLITGAALSYFLLLFRGPFLHAMRDESRKEIGILKNKNDYSQGQIKNIKRVLKEKDYKNKIIHHSLIVIAAAYAWEIIELYMEVSAFKNYGIEKLFFIAQGWFSGVEVFINRFFIDVALVYFGWYITRSRPFLSVVAAPISMLWLAVHIFIFQDSMYLHKHGFDEVLNVLGNIKTIYVVVVTGVLSWGMYKWKNKLK